MPKTSKLFEIIDPAQPNRVLATYHAFTAKAAVACHVRDQAIQQSVFRSSGWRRGAEPVWAARERELAS